MTENTTRREIEHDGGDRRRVLGWLASLGMFAGLIAAYGTLAAYAGRFLYPARPPRRGWLFVAELARLGEGASLTYRTPGGATVAVARQRSGDDAEAFVALSSTCPHLGCQVHWEPQNDRFFCPCHNGVFTPDGTAVSGPPADAGQSLSRYPLKTEQGLLFIEVPLDEIARGPGEVVEFTGPRGPGHDPCLCVTSKRIPPQGKSGSPFQKGEGKSGSPPLKKGELEGDFRKVARV